MLVVLVSLTETRLREALAAVYEAAPQNAGHFPCFVAMPRNTHARRQLEKERARDRARRDFHATRTHARGDPAPRPHFSAQKGSRKRQIGGQAGGAWRFLRSLAGWASCGVKRRKGAVQGGRLDRRGRAFVEQQTANRFELRIDFARLGTERQMGVDNERQSRIQPPCGVAEQSLVVGARERRHARSPS